MAQKINYPGAAGSKTVIVDRDTGYKDIVKFFEEVGGFIAKAGFIEGKSKPSSVFKAAINNFGGISSDLSAPIPPRPFIADAFDPNESGYSDELLDAVDAFFASRGKLGAKGVERKIKDTIARVAGDMDAELLGWSSPANAAYTISKKGFDDPLVETGAMANDIHFEVKRYKGESQLNRQLEAIKAPAAARSGGGGSKGGGFGGVFAKAALSAASALAVSTYEGKGIRAAPERRSNATAGVASRGTRRGANMSIFKL